MDSSARAWSAVATEIGAVLDQVDSDDVAAAAAFLSDRPGRWFFTGQGRSGLVAQMAAMRLMHLGRPTYVVGETTAPSVRSGDHMVAFSSSGTTPVTTHLAELAVGFGADLLTVTTRVDTPLDQLASTTLLVPITSSVQFGGSLFEQTALILFDALALQLSDRSPSVYAEMASRHTNLQ